jgi:predicted GNAT superfamily acetyltransferase
VSDAFHAALRFVEVGTASVYDGNRTVRYLSHALSTSAAMTLPR